MAAYQGETLPKIRHGLLCIISEFRTPFALPLLEAALRDQRGSEWKVALDGLVSLASIEAATVLESALQEGTSAPGVDSEYIEWVREALEQTRSAIDFKSRETSDS